MLLPVVSKRNPLLKRRRKGMLTSVFEDLDLVPATANVRHWNPVPPFREFADQSPPFTPTVGNAMRERRRHIEAVAQRLAPRGIDALTQFIASRLQFPEAVGPYWQPTHLFLDKDQFAAKVAALFQPVGVDEAQVTVGGLSRDRIEE